MDNEFDFVGTGNNDDFEIGLRDNLGDSDEEDKFAKMNKAIKKQMKKRLRKQQEADLEYVPPAEEEEQAEEEQPAEEAKEDIAPSVVKKRKQQELIERKIAEE